MHDLSFFWTTDKRNVAAICGFWRLKEQILPYKSMCLTGFSHSWSLFQNSTKLMQIWTVIWKAIWGSKSRDWLGLTLVSSVTCWVAHLRLICIKISCTYLHLFAQAAINSRTVDRTAVKTFRKYIHFYVPSRLHEAKWRLNGSLLIN